MFGVGVVGYGYWGPNLVRNFSDLAGCEVATVCDLRPERRELREQPSGDAVLLGRHEQVYLQPAGEVMRGKVGVETIRFQGPDAPTWKRGPRSVPGRGPRDTYG